jgi:hypothetical protein
VAQVRDELRPLYRGRPGRVAFLDIPLLNYLRVTGVGDPNDAAFTEAVAALHAVSSGARLLVRKERGAAPKVMPLEALWWADEPGQRDLLAAVALGVADVGGTDRRRWRWQAMIVQPEPVDENLVKQAGEVARKKNLPVLDDLRLERWEEGPVAQILHVGPLAGEGQSIVRLHDAIEAAGYRPRGHHHEIYLGDRRRTSPEKLRTLLRQPVEPI